MEQGQKGEVCVGVDWGTEEHEVAVLDARGEVKRKRFAHDGEGIAAMVAWLGTTCGDSGDVRVGIEVPRGAIVEALLLSGYRVFALNPKQLDRFRDRHTVAGSKSDALDAYVLADGLRHDVGRFREVRLDEEGIVTLRERVRMRDALVRERVRLTNQMRGLLQRYYTQALALGELDEPWVCDLLEAAPSPRAGARLQPKRVARILKARRIRRVTSEQVVATLRRPSLLVGPGVAESASEHLLEVIARVRLVVAQLERAEARIGESLDALKTASSSGEDEPPGEARPSDAALFASIAGAGTIVVAGILAEASDLLARRDYAALRALCGTAPVTGQSGKQRHGRSHRPHVHMRYACNQRLRDLMFHWARASLMHDAASKAYYTRHRARGSNFALALRAVGDRLLRILIGVLKSGEPYDPARFVSTLAPAAVAPGAAA